MQHRTFIKNSSLTAIRIIAFGGLNWKRKSQEGYTPTSTDILCPFYRPGAPLRNKLRLPSSDGTAIVLKGRNLLAKGVGMEVENSLDIGWRTVKA